MSAATAVDLESPIADPGRRVLAHTVDLAIPAAPATAIWVAGIVMKDGRFALDALLTLVGVWFLLAPIQLVLLARHGQPIGK